MSTPTKTSAIVAAHRAGTRTVAALVAATGASPSHVRNVCRANNLPLSGPTAAPAAAAPQPAAPAVPQPLTGVEHNGYNPGRGYQGCGDYSLGDEPSNRQTWETGNPDEPYITVTATYFVAGRRDSDTNELSYDDHDEVLAELAAWDAGDQAASSAPERVNYFVDSTTEWTAHTDLDELDFSAVRDDFQFEEAGCHAYASLEEAEEAARHAARNERWEHYHPENWR